MNKEQIEKLALSIATERHFDDQLPTVEFLGASYGEQRATDTFRKIRKATTRSRISRLVEAE